jgi:bifunctional non-homologous end joining protein LigD
MVPVDPIHDYAEARELCLVVARALEGTHRGLVTTEWAKARRRGVLIDSNQIGYGRTISSVYSVRPRPGAPVSTPLLWEEVHPDLDPLSFDMRTVLDRVERHGDLFAPVLEGGQELGPALARLR